MKLNLSILKKKPSKKAVIISVCGLAAFIFLLWVFGAFNPKDTQGSATELTAHTVSRGDITVSVTGSGTIEPIEQYEIQSIVTGDILTDNVVLGSNVEEGDILYTIDSESAVNNIERSEKSYEQQLLSYNQQLNNWNKTEKNRSVTSEDGGIITELYVKNGDEVSVGTKLCEVVNSEKLTLSLPFLASDAKNLSVGQSATVFLDDRNEQVTGVVSHIGTGTYATSVGAIVSDVEITVKNPGALLPGEIATAQAGNFACNDEGTLESSETEVISAKASGEIKNLSYSEGDRVAGGSVILKITDEDADLSLNQSRLSLENSELSLSDLIEKLDDYTITAPISGTVISKTLKAGDTLDGNKTALAIIADMSKLTFEINVDELDIKNISVGQSVIVTADALPDKSFEGVIDTISIIGTSASGVTVYPVTVVISDYEGLLPGMNVNAEIVISEAKNVLTVPVDAISRGNRVLMKDNGSEGKKAPENNDGKRPSGEKPEFNGEMPEFDGEAPSIDNSNRAAAPEGYIWVTVTTGASDDNNIEITSGLSEGDVIYITRTRNTQTSEDSPFAAMGNGMGGGRMPSGSMPSGMPGGGMPGGGMR